MTEDEIIAERDRRIEQAARHERECCPECGHYIGFGIPMAGQVVVSACLKDGCHGTVSIAMGDPDAAVILSEYKKRFATTHI